MEHESYLKEGFKGMSGDLVASKYRKALELLARFVSAKEGKPIQKDDLKNVEMLKSEFQAFSGVSVEEFMTAIKEYRLSLSSLVDDKGEFNQVEIKKLAGAIAGAKLERVVDLSSSQGFEIVAGRLIFKGDKRTASSGEAVSYSLDRLIAAVLASHESQSLKERKRTIQYPHVDKEDRILGKTVILLSEEVFADLEKALSKNSSVPELKNRSTDDVKAEKEKTDKLVKRLEVFLQNLEVQLISYGQNKSIEPDRDYTFKDLPKDVQEKFIKDFAKLNKDRETQNLPPILINPINENLFDQAKFAFPQHARDFSVDFMTRDARLWLASTEKTAIEQNGVYSPRELVVIFTHPVSAIRDIKILIEKIKSGEDKGKIFIFCCLEDFIKKVKANGMPGDNK